jgi:hypothetical protein
MTDYSARDKDAKVTFYVPLWKRNGISLEMFDNYWRDVHGPVCARLPGQFQYWQFHVGHSLGGTFPEVEGVQYRTADEDQFDGIAELTFKSVEDRQTWFTAAGILMDDEHNIFHKCIGYVTDEGNSVTYLDGIEMGAPNGEPTMPQEQNAYVKFHVMVRQAPGVKVEDFRRYMKETFTKAIRPQGDLLKYRLHLFEPPDVSRPDAAGVTHFESPQKQYQAAFEIGFRDHLAMERFFASAEYRQAVADQAKYVGELLVFPERFTATFVYEGQMTFAGIRGARTARLITDLGAVNQVKTSINELLGVKQPNG